MQYLLSSEELKKILEGLSSENQICLPYEKGCKILAEKTIEIDGKKILIGVEKI